MLNGCTHAKNIEELYSVAAVFVHSVKMRLTRRLMKAKKPKFKNRYVLGTGYPWITDLGYVCLWEGRYNSRPIITLKVPLEIWSEDIPKFRLVLEKVK